MFSKISHYFSNVKKKLENLFKQIRTASATLSRIYRRQYLKTRKKLFFYFLCKNVLCTNANYNWGTKNTEGEYN